MIDVLRSEKTRKITTVLALGTIGIGISASVVVGIKNAGAIADHFAPSPEDVLANANKAFSEAKVNSDLCFTALLDYPGVTGDLVDEIQHNQVLQNGELIDPKTIHGYSSAGRDINSILSAQHELGDSDHAKVAQIGDNYGYCVLENGEIIPDPNTFSIVVR